jgi:hypothetical protein
MHVHTMVSGQREYDYQFDSWESFWLFNITMTILNIIQRPVFHLKHDVSETGFCLHFQVETIMLELRSGDRDKLFLLGPTS